MPISFLRFTCKRIIDSAWFFDCIFGGFCCWNRVRKQDILSEKIVKLIKMLSLIFKGGKRNERFRNQNS